MALLWALTMVVGSVKREGQTKSRATLFEAILMRMHACAHACLDSNRSKVTCKARATSWWSPASCRPSGGRYAMVRNICSPSPPSARRRHPQRHIMPAIRSVARGGRAPSRGAVPLSSRAGCADGRLRALLFSCRRTCLPRPRSRTSRRHSSSSRMGTPCRRLSLAPCYGRSASRRPRRKSARWPATAAQR